VTRRDNGLPATSYVRLTDVETHVVDGLLDRLRDEDVAAYVAPSAGRRGPYGDTVLPGMPSDTVYVDSDRRDQARVVVDRYLAEVSEELAWAGILAGYDQPSVDEVPRWPASEDVEASAEDPGTDAGRSGGRSTGDQLTYDSTLSGFEELRKPPEPGRSDRQEAEEEQARAEAEEAALREAEEAMEGHFEPPPPPPVPLPDFVGRLAWAGLLGGPLFLIASTILDLDVAGWPGFTALAAFVGGFLTLVARMNDRPPTDSGPDDGAVV
jgi:hypothetical protein